MSERELSPDLGVTTVWSHPRSWRRHELGADPYWVEDEVEVTVEGSAVEQLSWSRALSDDERRAYDVALKAKWSAYA